MKRRGGISRTQNAAASHRQATSRHRLQPKVSLLRVSREVTLRKYVSHLAFLAFSNRPNIGLRLVYYTNTIRFNINLLCQTHNIPIFLLMPMVFALRCILSLGTARPPSSPGGRAPLQHTVRAWALHIPTTRYDCRCGIEPNGFMRSIITTTDFIQARPTLKMYSLR